MSIGPANLSDLVAIIHFEPYRPLDVKSIWDLCDEDNSLISHLDQTTVTRSFYVQHTFGCEAFGGAY